MSSYLPTVVSDSAGELRVAAASGGPASIIWDRVDITLSTSTPSLPFGSNASITWTGYYEYDKTQFNGRITLNDTTVKTVPGAFTYTVSKISDNKYNLTAFTSNSVTVTFVSQQPSTTTMVSSTASSSQSTTTTGSKSSSPSTSSTSASGTGAGGIPEFPYQAFALALFTVLLVVTYLAIRHRRAQAG
jgi:hypothetical protein